MLNILSFASGFCGMTQREIVGARWFLTCALTLGYSCPDFEEWSTENYPSLFPPQDLANLWVKLYND